MSWCDIMERSLEDCLSGMHDGANQDSGERSSTWNLTLTLRAGAKADRNKKQTQKKTCLAQGSNL